MSEPFDEDRPARSDESGGTQLDGAGRGASGDRPIDRREFLRGVGALGAATGLTGIDRLIDPDRKFSTAGLTSRPRDQELRYAIHPAIGIARMGNAPVVPTDPSTWYAGAESPWEVPNEGRPYKLDGRIKRQAQRFRIYRYDDDGTPSREIIAGEDGVESIEWTVHLVNRKSALSNEQNAPASSVPGIMPPSDRPGVSPYGPADTRNSSVSGDRTSLVIDTGEQTVRSPGEWIEVGGEITLPIPSDASGDSPPPGTTKAVNLGALYSEPGTGRLLVFASDGTSEGVLPNGEMSEYADIRVEDDDWVNNDSWHDSTADGWIEATIRFTDGRSITLDQPSQRAWVICAVPRYAPQMNMFTSIYDLAMSAAYEKSGQMDRPSFVRDIFPILRSSALLSFVSARAALGHSQGRGGYYLSEDMMRMVADNDPDPTSDAGRMRASVLKRIRPPGTRNMTQVGALDMPRLPTQVIRDPGVRWDVGSVTPLQYALLQRWAAGDFTADWGRVPHTYVPLADLPVAEQPGALDRAALESSCGTPLYPGIESWRILRDPRQFDDIPLRIAADVNPGDFTMGNALPWQADYLDCTDAWWPIQRPTEVTRAGEPGQSWAEPSWDEYEDQPKYAEMVRNWWRLGFVVSVDGGETYEEVERDPGLNGG